MDEITRRQFIKLTGLGAAAAALAACSISPKQTSPSPTPSSWASSTAPNPVVSPTTTRPPVKGTLTPAPSAVPSTLPASAVRTLRRITYAPLPEMIEHVRQIGLDAFIEEQLSPATLADPGMDQRLEGLKTLKMSAPELAKIEKREQPPFELSQAALARAVYSQRQLNELMVDFWSNHFNVSVLKNAVSFLKTVDDREVIRPHALGKFHDLLSASVHSPAMLVYLDNVLSTREKPNENYARELLELHTLGVDGGYTQTDVKEAARALTGWMVNGVKSSRPGEFVFNPRNHDDEEKIILGQRFAARRGIKDGEDLIDLIANHPSTARFICRKLVRRFVSDNPPESLVEKATAEFNRTRGNIASVMSIILRSVELRASLGQKAKRPFEFIVSALRVTGVDALPDRPTLQFLDLLGQPLFRLQTPNGYPDVASAWTTTNGLMGRWNFALALTHNQLKDSPVHLLKLFDAQAGVDAVIQQLSSRILGEYLPPETTNALREFLNKNDLVKAVPALVALALSAPIFQYR